MTLNTAVTDTRWSPNYTPGRAVPLRGIVIHHWGADGQDHDTVAGYLARQNGNTSAHYVASAGRVTQLVSDANTAWHCPGMNAGGIGIECRPECSDGDFETVAQLIAAIRAEWGYLPLSGHRDHYATACPGRWEARLEELDARALAIQNGAPTAAVTSSTTNHATDLIGDDMHIICTRTPWGDWAYALIHATVGGARAIDNTYGERTAYERLLGDAKVVEWDFYNLLVRQAWERHNAAVAAIRGGVREDIDAAVQRVLDATKKEA